MVNAREYKRDWMRRQRETWRAAGLNASGGPLKRKPITVTTREYRTEWTRKKRAANRRKGLLGSGKPKNTAYFY